MYLLKLLKLANRRPPPPPTKYYGSFAAAGSSPVAVDQHYFNLPWGGVRKSNLPYALEPENDGSLNYDDPDSTSYVPLCMWGDDEPGKCCEENVIAFIIIW